MTERPPVDLAASLRADTDRAALAAELADPRRAAHAAARRRYVRRGTARG